MFGWATQCIRSPSKSCTLLITASHSRTAFLTIVSNTGCTSVGELLITRRISLVAVCCSRAHLRMGRCKCLVLLLQLVEQAHILDRDHGLVGEGLQQGHLPLGEDACLGAAERNRAG